MRRRLRRFAAVGTVVTALDLALFVTLVRGAGVPPAAADAAAVLAAAAASYVLNRAVTFGGDPHVRWVQEPGTYATLALAAGAIDVAVVAAFDAAGALDGSIAALVAAKLLSVGVAAALRLVGYRRRLFRTIRAAQAPKAGLSPPPGDVRLSVVVPAYKEAGRIGATIAALRAALEPVAGQGGVEIVVVDDGSSDGTGAEAEAAGADLVVVQPRNRGKGAAVRAGVLASHGRAVAYIDADLAYSPDQLLALLEAVESGYEVVVGSRRHTGTVTLVKAGRLRELSGRVFNLLSEFVLLGDYRDTQCGLKALRSDAARRVFGRSRVDGFAFEIEVFHLAERYGLSLLEVPVTVVNSQQSTVRVVKHSLEMVRDLLRIRLWAGRGVYDLAAAPGTRTASGVGPTP